jgi:hypothetical protein
MAYPPHATKGWRVWSYLFNYSTNYEGKDLIFIFALFCPPNSSLNSTSH